MRTKIIAICIGFLTGIITIGCYAQKTELKSTARYRDPKRFEKAIHDFEISDKKQFPQAHAIVCIGSSSMRGWHDTIQEDLAPLTIIPRGFGGSNMNDALYYADRIVIPYKPRAVVIYEGDNDIAQGIAPEVVADTFNLFVGKIHEHLPAARIYFLSVKPSIRRWEIWQEMKTANRLIAQKCSKDQRLNYIDIATSMLDSDGNPRKDIFKEDNLHMNRNGYIIWRDVLRPVLLEAELSYEQKS